MVFPTGEWQERTPAELGIDPAKLGEALAYLAFESDEDGLEEVFIVRKGYFVYKGDSIHKKHIVYNGFLSAWQWQWSSMHFRDSNGARCWSYHDFTIASMYGARTFGATVLLY